MNLQVASKERLNVLPSELAKAIIKDLIEQLLVELSNLHLFLFDSLELDILEVFLWSLTRRGTAFLED